MNILDIYISPSHPPLDFYLDIRFLKGNSFVWCSLEIRGWRGEVEDGITWYWR